MIEISAFIAQEHISSYSILSTHMITCSFRNDLLCNRMVGIRFKSSLSTRDRFQFTSGVQWPFAASFLLGRLSLKRSFHFFIMLSRLFDVIAHMRLAVAINGQIYDAEIHSDEIGRSYRRDIRSLNCHEQKPLAVLASDKVALTVFAAESLGLILAQL